MRLTMMLAGAMLAVMAAACNGDGTETTVRTPSADDPDTVATGIPELDNTLNTALRLEAIELAGLTGYQHLGCVEEAEDAPSPPVCRENEDVGQEVESYPVLQCELVWVRPEVMSDIYAEALGEEPRIVAVYRPTSRALVLEADYVAVFDTNTDDSEAGVALWIKDGRVIQVEYDCNNFAGLYAEDKVEQFVIAPGGGDAGGESSSGE
ncbi:MAG: hypothetical protein WEB52_07955 [Dehalococcoidia bacterium]